DPTGPGTGPSRKDLDLLGDNFFARLLQRRPADRLDLVGCGLAHQVGGLAGEEDLHLMAGVRESQSVQEGERSPGRIIRAPSALHHDLEWFARLLSGLAENAKHRQKAEPG